MFPSFSLVVCELCEYFEMGRGGGRGDKVETMPKNQEQTLSYPLHCLYCFSQMSIFEENFKLELCVITMYEFLDKITSGKSSVSILWNVSRGTFLKVKYRRFAAGIVSTYFFPSSGSNLLRTFCMTVTCVTAVKGTRIALTSFGTHCSAEVNRSDSGSRFHKGRQLRTVSGFFNTCGIGECVNLCQLYLLLLLIYSHRLG